MNPTNSSQSKLNKPKEASKKSNIFIKKLWKLNTQTRDNPIHYFLSNLMMKFKSYS